MLLGEEYGSYIKEIQNELRQAFLQGTNKLGQTVHIHSLMKCLEPFKEVMCELYRLCKIAAVLPVSTAVYERSFSTLKLIKDHLRSTMGGKRLSNLAVFSIESERAKAIDLTMFVQHFAAQHKNIRLKLS